MLLGLRKGIVGIVQGPFDHRVEWLEGGGAYTEKYIDLGIKDMHDTTIEATWAVPADTYRVLNSIVCGSRNNAPEDYEIFIGKVDVLPYNQLVRRRVDTNPPEWRTFIAYPGDVVHTVVSPVGASAENYTQETSGSWIWNPASKAQFDLVYNLTLFKVNSTTWSTLPCRVYHFKLTSASKGVIMDLYPVRKDGVGYMYDEVSEELLGNSGTGAFGIGPDI